MPGTPETNFDGAIFTEAEAKELVRKEIDRALEYLGDELAFQIGKLHQLSGPNTQRAINDAVFMARRKIGQ